VVVVVVAVVTVMCQSTEAEVGQVLKEQRRAAALATSSVPDRSTISNCSGSKMSSSRSPAFTPQIV
jgi:hypothetical protein